MARFECRKLKKADVAYTLQTHVGMWENERRGEDKKLFSYRALQDDQFSWVS